MTRNLMLFSCLTLLMSTTCKKDFYDGTEVVLLNATLSNSNEVIRLGDTLRVTLTVPPTLTSQTGLATTVTSVQEAIYNFVLYRIDTLTNVGTRITSPNVTQVSKGRLSPTGYSVYTSTATPPFQSVLNIIPSEKGFYRIETVKGGLTVNNKYDAFLRVNFDVPNKHWYLNDRYEPGFSTDPVIIGRDAEGYGLYYFIVK